MAERDDQETVSALISALLAAGLTQAEIARRTRVPQPRLSRWSAGRIPVGANDALRLKRLYEAVVPGAPEGIDLAPPVQLENSHAA